MQTLDSAITQKCKHWTVQPPDLGGIGWRKLLNESLAAIFLKIEQYKDTVALVCLKTSLKNFVPVPHSSPATQQG